MNYTCEGLPLLNEPSSPYVELLDYGGEAMDSWAGTDDKDVSGCACNYLGTCPDAHTCRCDAPGMK